MVRKATTSTAPEPSTRSFSTIQSPPHSRAASPMNGTNGIMPPRRPEPSRDPRTSRGRSRETSGPVTRSRRRMRELAARGESSIEEVLDVSQRRPVTRISRRRMRESGTRRESDRSSQSVNDDLVGVGSFYSTQPHPNTDPALAYQNLREEGTREGADHLGEELQDMNREMRERRRQRSQQAANQHPRDIPRHNGRPRRGPDSPHHQ